MSSRGPCPSWIRQAARSQSCFDFSNTFNTVQTLWGGGKQDHGGADGRPKGVLDHGLSHRWATVCQLPATCANYRKYSIVLSIYILYKSDVHIL